MQRSILTPQQPLGTFQSNQVHNKTSYGKAIHPSSNSLVAQGSSLVVAPVSHSTASTTKKRNGRGVSTDISPRHHGCGSLGSNNVHGEISQMMEVFTPSNNALFHCSYREVFQAHADMTERLASGRATNNQDRLQ